MAGNIEVVTITVAYGDEQEYLLIFQGEPTRADIRRALDGDVEKTYVGRHTADFLYRKIDETIQEDGKLFGDPAGGIDVGRIFSVHHENGVYLDRYTAYPVS